MIGRPRSERGAVTAELALGLPLLLAVTVVMVWLVSVAMQQVRLVDGVRETARAVARGDDEGAAIDIGRRVAPPDAVIVVRREDGHVVVTGSVEVAGPGGVLGDLDVARLQAEAVALAEWEP